MEKKKKFVGNKVKLCLLKKKNRYKGNRKNLGQRHKEYFDKIIEENF